MRPALVAALLLWGSVPAVASEKPPEPLDADTCLNDALCIGVGPRLPAALEDHRVGMRVMMALMPMGALYVPRWFLEEETRPAWGGGLRRSTLLHGLGPCTGFACVPPLGFFTGPMGSVLGMVVGPVILAIVGGIAGFIVVPVGGTILGVCGGGIVGLVVGFVVGGVLGVLLGPLTLCLVAAGPLGFWQFFVAPASMMHAWRSAFELMPPKVVAPPVLEDSEPQPRQRRPAPPPPADDEGVTVK